MAANPIIASAASLLVPWESSETVTCHCHKCDTLLAIAPNSWTSRYPYLLTPGSICVFDNNIFSEPLSEPHSAEEGQHRSIICKHCLETVGHGVQKDMFVHGFPQFNFIWSSHSICLKDITTGELVASRLVDVMNESSLGASDANTCEPSSHQRQIDGPSSSKNNEKRNLGFPSANATSDEIQLMATEWRHAISSLQGEIQYLTTAISSLNQTPRVPHDGNELIATALREVRAKGIEIEMLKQENHSLLLKFKQLENMPLTRIERTTTINNHSFGTSPNETGETLTLDQSGQPLVLNSNGKRPLQEEISLSANKRKSQIPNTKHSQHNSGNQGFIGNSVSRPPYSSKSIPVFSNKMRHEATNSDTDELAQPWHAPKYQKLSTNVNCGERIIPSNENPSPRSPPQRQALEPKQAYQENSAKPRKRKTPAKTLRGRPRTTSLPTTASTTKIPLKEPDSNTTPATDLQAPIDFPNPQTVGESQIQDKPQPKKRARRASARLSRRSSLASIDHHRTQHPSNAEPNQVHPGDGLTLQQQIVELQDNAPHPTPNIEVPGKTIPNSQSDSDNAPLDQENSFTLVNVQTEEFAQKTAKPQNIRVAVREKRKSQIAARDSLAKLAMHREEALEATAH